MEFTVHRKPPNFLFYRSDIGGGAQKYWRHRPLPQFLCMYVCMYYFPVETFTLAAAAIMGASSSFSNKHGPSLISRRNTEAPPQKPAGKAKRSHTFSRQEIDSTPRMVSKFDKPYLER